MHTFQSIQQILAIDMQGQSEKKGFPNEVIKQRWEGFAPIYERSDSSNQTFFYTLAHMLQVNKASHILEVGCGAGKLIPYISTLKPKECTYFASDISETMIDLAKKFIINHNQKIGVSDSLQTWLAKQNIELHALNGEAKIDVPYKFDRIICNLVLQITEDPRNMLKNLSELAAPGCLLGVTVWGQKSLSNFLTLKDQALEHLGRPIPDVRSNFHLYNRIEEVAAGSGWEVVIQWEQNAPYAYFEMNETLKELNDASSGNDPDIVAFTEKKINETFKEKRILNFPAQLAVLRKK